MVDINNGTNIEEPKQMTIIEVKLNGKSIRGLIPPLILKIVMKRK